MSDKIVTVIMDRPLGSRHLDYPDMIYPINYGYIERVIAGDKEEQDAYVLGVDEPVGKFVGRVIAIIHREDDVEEKWVVAPVGKVYSREEIIAQTRFQEKYFNSSVSMLI